MEYIKEYNEYLSQNFFNWFGKSKILTKDKKPKIVYHGTSSDFDFFDDNKMGDNFDVSTLGFYFTDGSTPNMSKDIPYGGTASEYATNSQPYIYDMELKDYKERQGANILPVYLKIENPLIIDSNGWYSSVSAIDTQRSDIKRWLSEENYDGVICYDFEDPDFVDTVYIVFKSNQIKSAIGNNGNFSDSDNINEHYL